MSRTIRRTWTVDSVLTNVTSAELSDPTGTYGVKRNDNDAVVVADGTAMTLVSTGVYEHTFDEPEPLVAYTGYVEIVYDGQTYRFEHDIPAGTAVGPVAMTCSYGSLVNEVGFHLYGLRPSSSDLITDGVANTNQTTDILRAIAKGLQYVYSAHRWSFLRPLVSISTYPVCNTGTITVDVSGNVTGTDTSFPVYSLTAGGWLTIPSVGSFAVETYTSGTELSLAGYTGDAITSDTAFRLVFNTYSLPSEVDSLEGRLTYPQGINSPPESLERVAEIEIRRLLAYNNVPSRPQRYAEATGSFDPTVGSRRYVTFWPIPDAEYTLTATGTLRAEMIDSDSPYPLGTELLAPSIVESCLAAAERDIQGMDANHPDAVHNRALVPLLAVAIQRDGEYGSPDTLGVDYGGEGEEPRHCHRTDQIYWNAGGDYTGYL